MSSIPCTLSTKQSGSAEDWGSLSDCSWTNPVAYPCQLIFNHIYSNDVALGHSLSRSQLTLE